MPDPRIPTIPAKWWRQLQRKVQEAYPVAGAGVRIRYTSRGAILTGDRAAEISHPWRFSPRWNADGEIPHWEVSIEPGFLNGRDAYVGDRALTDSPAPSLILASFRDPIQSAGLAVTAAGDLVTLAGEGYPKFFEGLGVRAPEVASTDTAPAFEDPFRTRSLRAIDIVLVVPRLGTVTSLELAAAETGTLVTAVEVTLSNILASSDGRAQIRAMPKWSPPVLPTSLDRLQGTAADPQTDELLIGTLWLVSPPGAAPDDEPDGSWTPYPQHRLFWNLARAVPAQKPSATSDPLRLNTGLAFGLLDSLGNALLAPVNDEAARILDFLRSTSYGGKFWTI